MAICGWFPSFLFPTPQIQSLEAAATALPTPLADTNLPDTGKPVLPELPLPPTIPSNLLPAGNPRGRSWSSLFYHPAISKLVMFGGGRLTDVWTLDVASRSWVELDGFNNPPITRIGGVGAAYDPQAQKMIVFFYIGAGVPGETWSYDLSTGTWQNLQPAGQPLSRRFTSLVYDEKAARILLFGGALDDSNGSPTDELWEYDSQANAWKQLHPQDNPPPVIYPQLVYSPDTDRLILWGGMTDHPEKAVWNYDYSANGWSKTVYELGPHPDYDGALAYIPDLRLVYLYVGNQFWSYDERGGQWTELADTGTPGRMFGHSLAYDPQNRALVLFGGAGNEDTWLYNPLEAKWSVMVKDGG
jgi:hypothetical protein